MQIPRLPARHGNSILFFRNELRIIFSSVNSFGSLAEQQSSFRNFPPNLNFLRFASSQQAGKLSMSNCLTNMFTKKDASPNRGPIAAGQHQQAAAEHAKLTGEYGVTERGPLYSTDFRCYITDSQGPVSPWHDIPLIPKAFQEKGIAGRVFNMVVEIPRWTNAKMEINKANPFNPIMQDVKKGKARFVDNVFPYHGYIWNYGALPQTWEDPQCKDVHTDCIGDGDPIDVLELGEKILERGAVVQVKVLGILALIDEGETDWKLLCIRTDDPLAAKLDSTKDIEQNLPGYLKATNDWFRLYKVPTGKPENQFAFQGEVRDAEFACKIIAETHHQWLKLTAGERTMDTYSCNNTRLKNATSFKNAGDEAKRLQIHEGNVNGNVGGKQANQNLPERHASDTVQKWHFIKK